MYNLTYIIYIHVYEFEDSRNLELFRLRMSRANDTSGHESSAPEIIRIMK